MDFDNEFVNNFMLDNLFLEIKKFNFDSISKEHRKITIENFKTKWTITCNFGMFEIINLNIHYSIFLEKKESVIDFIKYNIL